MAILAVLATFATFAIVAFFKKNWEVRILKRMALLYFIDTQVYAGTQDWVACMDT